jgi:hypothetical protein
MCVMSMLFLQVYIVSIIVWWHVDLAYYLIELGLLCTNFIMHNASLAIRFVVSANCMIQEVMEY